jgi:hypothetical protein
MTADILNALDLTPTMLFWCAIPLLGFAFYWLAPWVSSQRKKHP